MTEKELKKEISKVCEEYLNANKKPSKLKVVFVYIAVCICSIVIGYLVTTLCARHNLDLLNQRVQNNIKNKIDDYEKQLLSCKFDKQFMQFQ